jgi:hypothetical protein
MDNLNQIKGKLDESPEIVGLSHLDHALPAAAGAYTIQVGILPILISVTAGFAGGVFYIRVQYCMHLARKEKKSNLYRVFFVGSTALRRFFIFSTFISVINVEYNTFFNNTLYSKFGFLKGGSLDTNGTLLSEEFLAIFRSEKWIPHA